MRRTTASPGETRALAAEIAAGLRYGDVLFLEGDLGAGKTEFVKGLAAGLGATEPVQSPTFGLVHEYRIREGRLFHLDFYRLDDARAIHQAGLDQYFEPEGISVIEWASRWEARLFIDPVRVHIEVGEGRQRHFRIDHSGGRR